MIIVVSLVSPAAAHGNLVASTPTDGTAVIAPSQIRLEFSTFVIAAESTVEIAALNGTKLELGQIVRGSSAAELVIAVLDSPNPGRYVLRYDVTGSDGDSIAGGFDFEIVDVDGEDPRLTGGAAAIIGIIGALGCYVWFALRKDKLRRPSR